MGGLSPLGSVTFTTMSENSYWTAFVFYEKGVSRCSSRIYSRAFIIYHLYQLPKVPRNSTVSLFADDTTLHCSSESVYRLQTKLNEDLIRVAQWLCLYEHKLTLDISKSKFIMDCPKKLTSVSEVTLTIDEKTLDRVSISKYLSVIINGHQWKSNVVRSFVVEYLRGKVLTTWGDKSNVTLMKKVQVLQNLAAKIVFSRFAKTFICYRGARSAGLGKLNKKTKTSYINIVFQGFKWLDWLGF